MRMVPNIWLLNTMMTTPALYCTAVASFLAVHHVLAIAGKGDHGALGRDDLGGDAGRDAVTHGAAGWRQLRAHGAVTVEAVRPRGVIAGAVGENGVGGRLRHDVLHHLPQVEWRLAVLEDRRPFLVRG